MYSIYHLLSVEQTGANGGIHNSLPSGRRVSITGAAGMKSVPDPALVLCGASPAFGQLPLAGAEADTFPRRSAPSISPQRPCSALEGFRGLGVLYIDLHSSSRVNNTHPVLLAPQEEPV